MKSFHLISLLFLHCLSGKVLATHLQDEPRHLQGFDFGTSFEDYGHSRYDISVQCTIEVIDILYTPYTDFDPSDSSADLSQLSSGAEVLCVTDASYETDMTYPFALSSDNYDEGRLQQLTGDLLELHEQGLDLSLTITHANLIRSADEEIDDRIELTPQSESHIDLSRGHRELVTDGVGSRFVTDSTRTRTLLVVLVHSNNTTEWETVTPATLSQSYFGTTNSTLTHMNKQYGDCSNNQMEFVATTVGDTVVNGVVEVTLNRNLAGANHSSFSNDVMTALTTKVNLAAGSTLGSTYDHVVYCYPPGTLKNGKSWFAYASKPGQSSYYNGNGCEHLGGQVHEIGHNLDLTHSSEDDVEYGDTTCQMGISSRNLKCFNGAKNWYTGWFKDHHKDVTLDDLPFNGKLETYVDLHKGATVPMIVRVPSGIGHLYLEYNRKKDHNAGTGELGDTVTAVFTDNLKGKSFLQGSASIYTPGVEILGYVIDICSVNDNEGSSPDYVTMSVSASGELGTCQQCRKNYLACTDTGSTTVGVTFAQCKALCSASSCKSLSYKYADQSCNVCAGKNYPASHVTGSAEAADKTVFIDMTQTSSCTQPYGCDFDPADPTQPARKSCSTGTLAPTFTSNVVPNQAACNNLGSRDFLASFDDCRDACGTTSGCTSFSYDAIAFHTPCNLCNSTQEFNATGLETTAIWSDLDTTVDYPEPHMVSYRENTEACYSIGHRDFVGSLKECLQLCSEREGCGSVSWYFNTWYGRCHFCDKVVPIAALPCDEALCSEWARLIQ